MASPSMPMALKPSQHAREGAVTLLLVRKPAHGIIFSSGVRHSLGPRSSGFGSTQGNSGIRGRNGSRQGSMAGNENAAAGGVATAAKATSKVATRRFILDGAMYLLVGWSMDLVVRLFDEGDVEFIGRAERGFDLLHA